VARKVLCWGTVEGTPLPELVDVAAAAGFAGITVTPAMYFAARAEGHTDAELRARLDDQGVAASVVDPLLAALPGCPAPESVAPRFRATFEHGEADAFRAALALGAPTINVAHYMGAPTPVDALAEAVAGICQRAAQHGLTVCVEFMPEGSLTDLATATRIVELTGAPNAGVMLDVWHFFRTGGDVADVEALPAGTVKGLQLSDAPAHLRGVGTNARVRDRLLPGDGVIPLTGILAALGDDAAVDWGVEVFDTQRPAREMAAAASAALDRLASAFGRKSAETADKRPNAEGSDAQDGDAVGRAAGPGRVG
jgi:sugar phosphate isomerase/epimerase